MRNAYSIVKCAFKDNGYKPKTVSDVKLSVNILDSELISPIFHYQVTVEYIIKDLISKNIMDLIDREIENLKEKYIDEGKEEMNDSEILFEKMRQVEKFTGDEKENEKSNRYKFFAKSLMERVEGLRAEIDPESFDQLNIRENLKKIIDLENIRNRGYNTAVNSITSILDTSKMGYQFVENLKNARELTVREYEDTDPAMLPDERYSITLKYYDNAQLIEERKAYDAQIKSFEVEIEHSYDILQMVYDDSKFMKGIVDFDDLAKRYRNKIRKRIKAKTGDPLYEEIDKTWNEGRFCRTRGNPGREDEQDLPVRKRQSQELHNQHEAEASGYVRVQVPDQAARHGRQACVPREGIQQVRLHDQSVPYPARSASRCGHYLHQEEEGYPGRYGQCSQRVPPRRFQGVPGCRFRIPSPGGVPPCGKTSICISHPISSKTRLRLFPSNLPEAATSTCSMNRRNPLRSKQQ